MTSYLRRATQFVSTALKLTPKRILAGKDLQGNKYYEVPPQRYFLGLLQNSRNIRYVEPFGTTARPKAITVKVTKEWEAWLRKKRDDAPSLEELQNNVDEYNIMQGRIRRLNEQTHHAKHLQQKESPKKEEQSVDSWSTDKS